MATKRAARGKVPRWLVSVRQDDRGPAKLLKERTGVSFTFVLETALDAVLAEHGIAGPNAKGAKS